jgi:hypothetical protein
MKKALGVILIILGLGIGIWCFLVAVRMVLSFSLGGISQILAFLFYVLCVGGGIALIFLGRRLHRG